jgi:acyl-CoA synthetase (AMP-forming)/AMP-acid ligase II
MDVDRVGQLTAAAARRWPDREVARLGDQAITFAGLHRWAETLGTDLVRGGVRTGDRVMLMLPNCLEVLAATTAAWHIGAVAVPVVPIYRVHEITQIVTDSRPACVVTSERLGAPRAPHRCPKKHGWPPRP